MINLIFILIMLISLTFSMLKHPLSMGLTLIIQTFLISIYLGSMSQNFWFSYILFLVMVGGLLILFIYIISMIYNKIFIKLNFLQNSWKLLLILLITYTYIYNYNYMNNMETIKMNILTIDQEMANNLIKLYNFPMNLINLMLINYLFFLLIISVKITNFYYGPLRLKM